MNDNQSQCVWSLRTFCRARCKHGGMRTLLFRVGRGQVWAQTYILALKIEANKWVCAMKHSLPPSLCGLSSVSALLGPQTMLYSCVCFWFHWTGEENKSLSSLLFWAFLPSLCTFCYFTPAFVLVVVRGRARNSIIVVVFVLWHVYISMYLFT